jgi:hypothetical protein
MTDTLAERITKVHGYYAALIEHPHGAGDLHGVFLFAGNLTDESTALLRAANIAGAASLVATHEAALARAALHEGAIDFLVTSLDEALRILKNELRKRQRVAVAVSIAAELLAAEMLERGVQPDLFAGADAGFAALGAQPVAAFEPAEGERLHLWPIPAAWARRTTELDALLLEQIDTLSAAKKRWLRLAPRYLGREARTLRSLACDAETAAHIEEILRGVRR